MYKLRESSISSIATELFITAAQHGHAEMVHLLRRKGANPETVCSLRGATALMYAAHNGNLPTLEVRCGFSPTHWGMASLLSFVPWIRLSDRLP